MKLAVVESAINSILATVKRGEISTVSNKQKLDKFLKNYGIIRLIFGCPSPQVNTQY